GKQLAVEINDAKDANIWVYDMSGATALRQLTFGGHNYFPVWSADGERVTFMSDRQGDPGLFWQLADASDAPERLTRGERNLGAIPESWSPDGKGLLFARAMGSNMALHVLTLPDKQVAPFAGIESVNTIGAAYSPDGRWVAYSPGSGVFIQPVPPTGVKYQ